MSKLKLPNNFNDMEISSHITEDDLIGCYLHNDRLNSGGFFIRGDNHGYTLYDGENYSYNTSQSGDCLYEHITINNHKVYKQSQKTII